MNAKEIQTVIMLQFLHLLSESKPVKPKLIFVSATLNLNLYESLFAGFSPYKLEIRGQTEKEMNFVDTIDTSEPLGTLQWNKDYEYHIEECKF